MTTDNPFPDKQLHHFTDSDKDTHAKALLALAQVLPRENPDRKDTPTGPTGSDLTDMVNDRLPDGESVSTSTVRDLIQELPESRGVPVTNHGQGYFVITSADTFRREMAKKEQKRQSIREHQQAIAAAYQGSGSLTVDGE